MKMKLATLLTAVILVALGVSHQFHTQAKNSKDSPTTSAVPSAGVTAPIGPLAPNPNFGSNFGRITRIYPEPTGVYFTLGGQSGQFQTGMNPTNGYYFIPLSSPNSRSLIDLLYLAAEKDWSLKVRTQPSLSMPSGRAEVIYLVQDFSRP